MAFRIATYSSARLHPTVSTCWSPKAARPTLSSLGDRRVPFSLHGYSSEPKNYIAKLNSLVVNAPGLVKRGSCWQARRHRIGVRDKR